MLKPKHKPKCSIFNAPSEFLNIIILMQSSYNGGASCHPKYFLSNLHESVIQKISSREIKRIENENYKNLLC